MVWVTDTLGEAFGGMHYTASRSFWGGFFLLEAISGMEK